MSIYSNIKFTQAVAAIVITAAVYIYWNQILADQNESALLESYRRRKRDVCFNVGAITYLQKLQLKRALYEQSLFNGNNQNGDKSSESGGNFKGGGVQFKKDAYKSFYVNNKRLASFYTLNFGGVNMMIPPQAQAQAQAHSQVKSGKAKAVKTKLYQHSFDEAFYYRILKSGNEYIRYLIYRYAYYFGDSIEYKANTCKLHDCADNNVHAMSHIELRSAYFSYHKNRRFPFTFVRSPMKRFLSAYSEIEYSWSGEGGREGRKPPADLFPLISRLGSKERFEEFVNSLISYFGKEDLPDLDDDEHEKYIDDRENAPIRALFDITSTYSDMFYIAPMIGTILLARDKEKDGDVLIYKLEAFEAEWRNITNSLGLKSLDNIVLDSNKPENYTNAKLASDSLGTRLAALSFLGFASDEVFSNLFYQKSNSNSNSNNEDGGNMSYPCSDDLFCYKKSKVAMPVTTAKQFEVLRKRSRFVTRAICRLYLADFQCLNYDLPSVCIDLKDEWTEDTENYFEKIEGRRGGGRIGGFHKESFSVSALIRALPLSDDLKRIISEGICLFEASPPQCIVDIIHHHDSIARDNSITEIDANEADHLEDWLGSHTSMKEEL